MRIAAGIPTIGRPQILRETISHIAGQSRPPDVIYIAPSAPEDLGSVHEEFPNIRVVMDGLGSSRQRNIILDDAEDIDVMVFFDDDFFPSPDYLEQIERIFNDTPDVMVATGNLIADGIHGPGFSVDEGKTFLSTAGPRAGVSRNAPTYNGYGCNMAVRMAPVTAHNIRFDENLPQYGWLEDLDFSRQLASYGDILRYWELRGVHLGTKSGRQSGRRLGYSQIANVIYLMRKGTCKSSVGVRTMLGNLWMNLVRSPAPEPYVDRRGRMLGNLEALGDFLIGRIDPRKIDRMR